MDKSALKMMLSFMNMPPLWRECLSSAFRTALACTIVAAITLYGPASIRNLITFPAFSYVVVILVIINDATLGDSLRGCWFGLYATIQSLGPATLSLWIIGPSRFTKGTTSLAVALAAFVVVLPSSQSTHLIAKRISLGQIVLVYVLAYANGVHIDPLMHPIHLAASTALGVLASVLALLLPYPRLACHQVNKNYKLLTNNILKRLKLLVKVISEEEKTCAFGLLSHAKSLVTKRTKLLTIILRVKDGMQWEMLPVNILRPHCMNLGERLEEVDTNLRGMELALNSTKSFPVNILDQDLKHGLNRLEEHVNLTIKNAKHGFLGGGSLTVPESSAKNITHFLHSLHNIPTTHQQLPIFFYLFCAKLLHKKSLAQTPTTPQDRPIKNNQKGSEGMDEKLANWATKLRNTNILPALKFSFALGLSIFMGLLYSKENGFWSGLPVAVSYVSGREATFRAANVKAQGTVIGTVYGVLGCFVFERLLPIRFLSLLPWFIFTSFLQRSKMYGAAGGISAIIGAVLILGRKNIGPPSEFAIVRIIETFIGLTCSIFVDLLFWPKRASACAKVELSQCFAKLNESIGSLSLTDLQLEENQRMLKMQVNELKKFVIEAEAEPNFWFLPFNSGCYNKLLGSLTKLMDVLHFGARALKSLQQEFQRSEAYGKENVIMLQSELGHVKEIICSSLKSLEEISKMKSIKFVEKDLEKKNVACDIELGKSMEFGNCMVSGLGEDGIEEIIGTFLQRSRDVIENLYGDEGEKEVKSEVVLNLSAIGFCLNLCMNGTIEIEEAMRELVQWENPSSGINLSEISCKLHALNNE